MAYELGGKKKPYWDLVLESFGIGGPGDAALPGASVFSEPDTPALDETEEERIARLRKKYLGKITNPGGAVLREQRLLGGKGVSAGPNLLGADDPRRKVSWRQY